jgi:hypothetical protein
MEASYKIPAIFKEREGINIFWGEEWHSWVAYNHLGPPAICWAALGYINVLHKALFPAKNISVALMQICGRHKFFLLLSRQDIGVP